MDISDGWRADWWNEAERLGVASELRRLNAVVDAAMSAKISIHAPPTAERVGRANQTHTAFVVAFKEFYNG